MTISFEKIKKIELKNYLINILLILILFGALYFLRIKFLKEISIESPRVIKKVRVDFDSLENQKEFLEKLNPYEEIPKFEGEKGRENPFLPY
jgi:type II secretory pathway component PulC